MSSPTFALDDNSSADLLDVPSSNQADTSNVGLSETDKILFGIASWTYGPIYSAITGQTDKYTLALTADSAGKDNAAAAGPQATPEQLQQAYQDGSNDATAAGTQANAGLPGKNWTKIVLIGVALLFVGWFVLGGIFEGIGQKVGESA